MTLQHVETDTAVRWMSPAGGLWVASRPGEHAGMVERIDGRYVATDARATVLGEFEELGEAQAAVEGRRSRGRARDLTRRLLGVNAAMGSLLAIVAGALVVR